MLYRIAVIILAVCFTLSAIPALADEITLNNMDLSTPLKATLKKIVSLTGEDTREHRHYHVQQGSCTDGTYGIHDPGKPDSLQGLTLESESVGRLCGGLRI